jgi:hypothetical protein
LPRRQRQSPKSVHAPKEGPIIYVSPWEDTIKAFKQRQFSDPETYFVVPCRVPRPLAEGQVTEVSMSVQAAEIRFAEFHQDLLRGLDVPRVFEVVRHSDWVTFRITEVITGQELLHFKCPSWAICDDPPGPPLDRLTFLTPVFFDWIPYSTVLQSERCQS